MNAAKDPQLTVLSNFGDHEHQLNYPELKITDQMTRELPRPIFGIGTKLPINGRALKFKNFTEVYRVPREEDEDFQGALKEAAYEGLRAMSEYYDKIEPELLKNGSVLSVDDPAAFLWRFSAPQSVEDHSRGAYAALVAAKKIQER